MREWQLHYFWERSLLPNTRLKTFKGEPIQILSKGNYNEYESGPDFLNARIAIGELIWVGSVEIHLKSSDWKKHGHHHDAQYGSVILHVVFEHDLTLDPLISSIPTLAVSDYFDAQTIEEVARGPVINKTILCKDQLKLIPELQFTFIKEQALFDRLTQKVKPFELLHPNPKEILYQMIAEAFGKKVNVLPFQQITTVLPLHELLQMNEAQRMGALTNQIDSIYSMKYMGKSGSAWKQKGLRPHGFPTIRILQFAAFVADYDFDYHFVHFSAEEIHTYLMRLFKVRGTVLKRFLGKEISNEMKSALIVNAFAPFLFWYGQHIESESIVEKSMELLRMTSPEDNHITRVWKKTSVELLNAADSQAHLAIYKQFCQSKNCLKCPVGRILLNE
jgi:hypothetical protein